MAGIPSKAQLAGALDAAGSAHHDYQVSILDGVNDAQWAGFYAAYVLGRVGDFATPSDLTRWLQSAPDSDQWSDSAADHVLAQL